MAIGDGSAEASLPSTIGNYRIERELGRGGMGAVYVGVHQLIGKRAAIKVLLPQVSQRADLVQRFFNEARAATAIHHPGIVDVHDYGIGDDGNAYLVMEYLDGESLAARMRSHGRLAVPTAVAIARQIALALAAAHRAGIIHRDLKPDNVFLLPDPDGDRIKLLDFGVAKLVDDAGTAGPATVTGAILGTPAYMSPEQCEGSRVVDQRSDLYSLGCTMFAMLTGRLPFIETGIGGLIGAHLHTPAPELRDHCASASPALAAIVDRLLAKAPDARFQTAEDLAAALAAPQISVAVRPAAIPDTPIATTTDGPTLTTEPPTPPPMRSMTAPASVASPRRARWPFVIAGVVVVAAIAAVVIIGRDDELVAATLRPIEASVLPERNPRVEVKPADPVKAVEDAPRAAADLLLDLVRGDLARADYVAAASDLERLYRSNPDAATRVEADKLKAALAPKVIANEAKRIGKLRDAGKCQAATEAARKIAATWGKSPVLDRATEKCKSEAGSFDDIGATATTGPVTTTLGDDKATEIIAAYGATDYPAAMKLCLAHPPDRPATYAPCLVSACRLKRGRVAVAWMQRKPWSPGERDQIINALNLCRGAGVILENIAKEIREEAAKQRAGQRDQRDGQREVRERPDTGQVDSGDGELKPRPN